MWQTQSVGPVRTAHISVLQTVKWCASMVARYSIMGAHAMEPGELGKVRPTTLLQFLRATKSFSWTLVILGLRIGPNINAGRLRLCASKVKGKVRLRISCERTSIFFNFRGQYFVCSCIDRVGLLCQFQLIILMVYLAVRATGGRYCRMLRRTLSWTDIG